MRNAGLDEAQVGIKIAGRNMNNLRYANDTTLMAESEEELKSLLMKVKKESEKVGLQLNIQKTQIMASSPITSWQIDGETAADFILGGSKITADGDYSHEIKRCLLRGRSQDGRGVGWGKHFLPHKFIKRAFKRRVNSTKQLLNDGRGHQAPRKATQVFERR